MEPSLAFAPNGKLLFQAWELSSDVPGGFPPVPVLVRHDGGDRWSEVSPDPARHPASLDPYLYSDPATGRVFTLDWIGGGNPYCSTISYSDDGARTWVTSPLACGGFDGEAIAAGPPVSSPTIGYPNIVYYCTGASLGTGEPITTPSCSKSLDGGLTFQPTGGYPFETTGAGGTFPGWAGNPVVDPRRNPLPPEAPRRRPVARHKSRRGFHLGSCSRGDQWIIRRCNPDGSREGRLARVHVDRRRPPSIRRTLYRRRRDVDPADDDRST